MSQIVLVIDPDQTSRQFLEQILQKDGHQVVSTGSGKEGLITAWRNPPVAIIIDPVPTDISPSDLVSKLRNDSRTATRMLYAFSSLKAPEEIQAAIDLGFDEYLPKQKDSVTILMQAIREVINRASEITRVPISARPVTGSLPSLDIGQVIVFLSAKGGTGTSSLCANVAAMTAELYSDEKVAVVDMVLPIGSIATIVGREDAYNIVTASQQSGVDTDVNHLKRSLTYIENWGFKLLAGSSDPEESQEVEITRIPVLINTLKRGFDTVFIDLGRTLSRISLPIILSADQLVMVMGGDEATVALSAKVIRYLKEKGLENSQLHPLINRAVGLEGMTKAQIEEALKLQIPAAVPYAMGNFTVASNQHTPLHKKLPDATASYSIKQIAEGLHNKLERARSGLRI